METQIIKHRILVSDVVEQHREIREEIVALTAEVGAQSVPVTQPTRQFPLMPPPGEQMWIACVCPMQK